MSADCAFVLWDIFGIANAWLGYGNDAYEIYHGICLYTCTLGYSIWYVGNICHKIDKASDVFAEILEDSVKPIAQRRL